MTDSAVVKNVTATGTARDRIENRGQPSGLTRRPPDPPTSPPAER
jgi:hypothetical protein